MWKRCQGQTYFVVTDPCATQTDFIADVTDAQLSASSSSNTFSDAARSRFGTLETGALAGGWSALIGQVGEWIQVDLAETRQIKRVGTQGRSEGDSGHERNHWVTSYKITYSDVGWTFSYILSSDGSDRVFAGNTDRDTLITNDFDSPITARYFRLYPQTWHVQIALRWELYGCPPGKY